MRDDELIDDEETADNADDVEGEEDVVDEVAEVAPKNSKAWRSIERYREMKELHHHLDDLFFEVNPEDLRDL